MAQQKQVPQQEQPPQDADAIFAAREAVLIDEVEALRRTRDEAEAAISTAQEQARQAGEGLGCWEVALNEYRRRHGRSYDPEVFASKPPVANPAPQRRPQGEFARFLGAWAANHNGEVKISEALAEAGELITHIQDPKGRARGILARKGFEKLAAGHYRAPATAEASPNGTPADAAAVVSG